MGEDTNWLMAR